MNPQNSWLKPLALPLAVGLVIRELLAPWTGHPFDFEIWVRLGYFMQSGASPYSLLPLVSGLSFAPYSLLTSISYPPLPAFMFALIYKLYVLLGSPSPFFYYFLLKQPVILGDLATSELIFKLVAMGGDLAKGRRLASLWLYLPFTVIVSSMWGALDPLALFLILASLYTYKTGRPYLSAAFLGIAVYLKLMPVIFLPVFLIQGGLSNRERLSYSAIALLIPLVGTLIPEMAFGWGFSSMYSAVSFQGDLSAFGGMSIFLPLSLMSPLPSPISQALGLLWVPVLLLSYVYIYKKKMDIAQGLLVAVLVFSISRAALPEQWAVYPLALLLIGFSQSNWKHFIAIGAVASTYLLVNNLLLVRFFSPISSSAYSWDLFVDNTSGVAEIRYAILVIAAVFFFAEALSVIAGLESILSSKLKAILSLTPRSFVRPLVYLAAVSVTGGLLDFTVIGLVTSWEVPIQSHSFLGLSPLSLYHIMLVIAFETTTAVLILFSRRTLTDSIDLFLLLTSLNVAASGIALVLFRVLDGTPALSDIPIYLTGSSLVTERFFVVFTFTIAFIGVMFRREAALGILRLRRMAVQSAPRQGRVP